MNWNKLTDPTQDSPELPELDVHVMFYYKDGNKYLLGRLVEYRGMKIWESDHRMHFPLPTGKITHWTSFDRVPT